MKILHVSASAIRGGTEKNCYHFIKAMPEYNHEVLILDKDGPMVAEWKKLNTSATVLDLLDQNLFIFWRRFKKSLPHTSFDKIIVWTNMRMPLVLSVLDKYTGSSIYVHIGNPIQPSRITTVKNVILARLLRVNNKVHLRPVSEFVQKSLDKDVYYKTFSSKVSMKPIIAPAFFVKKPEVITERTPIKLGMVARIDEIKDHGTVIQAFAKILSLYQLATLSLVGDGSLRENFERMSLVLNLDKSIIFHGDVSDVYSLMKDWDLFVYATTMNEGLGGTIPEALSMGLPVVAVDLPMIREWDKAGTYINFCKPFHADSMAEKAIEVLKSLEMRESIYKNAPRYIQNNFSPRSFAVNYISDQSYNHQ